MQRDNHPKPIANQSWYGGTDLPSYYERSGGFLIAAAIDRYVYVTVMRPLGAGGGGFLMFYAQDRQKLRQAMAQAGLEEVRFRFDFEGTKVLLA